jgi:hypothetical protein
LVKGKAFETREKFSNLMNASQNSYSFTFDYLQNDFEKILQKNLQNKTCGARVVQNVKKQKHSCISYEMNIGLIPSNFCTRLMQTSSIILLYICFGLCWHQSPKRGRLKGK